MSSIDWKRVLQSVNLSLGKWKKSAGAISGEHDGCSMIFVEFLAFTRLSFERKFRSYGISRAATRFMTKQSFKMVRIDSSDTESSVAISLKLEWQFSVTISFFLTMLTLVGDVDGRTGRGKSSSKSRPLLNALYHSYARIFEKFDSP